MGLQVMRLGGVGLFGAYIALGLELSLFCTPNDIAALLRAMYTRKTVNTRRKRDFSVSDQSPYRRCLIIGSRGAVHPGADPLRPPSPAPPKPLASAVARHIELQIRGLRMISQAPTTPSFRGSFRIHTNGEGGRIGAAPRSSPPLHPIRRPRRRGAWSEKVRRYLLFSCLAGLR